MRDRKTEVFGSSVLNYGYVNKACLHLICISFNKKNECVERDWKERWRESERDRERESESRTCNRYDSL